MRPMQWIPKDREACAKWLQHDDIHDHGDGILNALLRQILTMPCWDSLRLARTGSAQTFGPATSRTFKWFLSAPQELDQPDKPTPIGKTLIVRL